MNLGQVFNRDEMPEGSGNFDPIPAGWYTAQIAKTELKDTKDSTGQYINMQMTITGPSYQGRVVFAMINIRNKSQKAEEIGRQQLGDLMRALGLARVQDTDELIGGNLSVKVDIQQSPGYDPKTVVKSYKAIEGSAPPMPTPAPTKSTGAAPPWAKK